jgi:hypothetical protein
VHHPGQLSFRDAHDHTSLCKRGPAIGHLSAEHAAQGSGERAWKGLR